MIRGAVGRTAGRVDGDPLGIPVSIVRVVVFTSEGPSAVRHRATPNQIVAFEGLTCTFAPLDVSFGRLVRRSGSVKTMTGSEALSEKPSLYNRLGGVYNIATVAKI
jgi:hypothetical protein